MTPERWRQVTAIFHAARGREPAIRAAFLDQACAGDASLRSEVDSLLAGHEDAGRAGTSAVSTGGLPQLSPGTAFGQYRIEGLVGSGGMGQVYRATDPRLHRTVAIKVLMPTLVPDAETDARFEREARLLASLNHPNIAAIHGLETAGTVQGLVLEFVDGQTLGTRLSKGRVPVPEALTIARQIALALEAAHEKGIVHRDLKPANVKTTPSGVVKVLDFGIARIAADGQMPAATTMGATGTGMILGTPAYMSPEQARGQAIDKRTDVWAFGCVLYEMLTGRGAFAADTSSDSVARVLEREPDWTKLPPDVPPSIVRLLRRCLQKDVGNRLRDIGDAGIEIADAMTPGGPDVALHDVPAVPRRMVAGIAAAIVSALALAALGVWRMTPGTPPSAAAAVEFGVMFPGNLLPSFGVSVSPDGRYVAAGVFGVASQIWLHSLATNDTRPVPGTESGILPFWSPDSSTVGYAVRDQLWTVAVAGGSPIPVGRIGPGYRGATWHSNGTILVAAQGKILRIPAAGGTPVEIPLDATALPWAPSFLPDGRHFVFTAWKRFGGDVFLASIDSDRATRLLEVDALAGFAVPDRLLFVRGASLFAQRIDVSARTLTGTPELVASGIVPSHLYERSQMTISASTNGVLAYPAARGGSAGQLRWFDGAGKAGESIASPPEVEYINPAISPDGTVVAANRADPQTGRWDIWLVDTTRGVPSKLTTNPADDFDPVWSPDGKAIVFGSRRGERLGLNRQSITGGDDAELLIDFDNSDVVATDWSRDPQYILYQLRGSVMRGWSIWALPLFDDRKPIRLMDEEFSPYGPHLSPDGKWLAYNSFESGPLEVFVRRFLADGPKKQISHDGGVHPRWTRDGKELVYWSPPGGIYSHTISMTESTITVGPRQTLLDRPVLSLIDGRTHYDITRDGTRLLVRQPAGPTGPGIKVILNWTSKLKS